MPIPNSETLATQVSPVSPEPISYITIGGVSFRVLDAAYQKTSPHQEGYINAIALHEQADSVTREMKVGNRYQVTLRKKDGTVVSGYNLRLKDLDVFAKINPPGAMFWFTATPYSHPDSSVRV